MSTTIAPSVGQGIDFVQQGIGASPGYSAIDVRRAGSFLLPGIINTGAYLVAQRGAGANMSVDIAASSGSAVVGGTTISNQGYYTVPPHSAVINETITTADATNPRVDQIVLTVFDNVHDSSGKNLAQTSVVVGTPTAAATIGISGNRNGAAALPANSIRLADVLVGAGVTSITNANIFDRRPKQRGKANIAAANTLTSGSFVLMGTPDQVTEIVLPTDGLIMVAYQALWKVASSTASAAIFLNANQIKGPTTNSVPVVQSATTTGTFLVPLITNGIVGLTGGNGTSSDSTEVTTGEITGAPVPIFAAAGTYHVSVQFANSANVTRQNAHLWVWVMDPDLGVLG